MRLGFSVRVLGLLDMPAHDGRRWPQAPHLSVSLGYLRDILLYLQRQRIGMYRLHSRLLPDVASDPETARRQAAACVRELEAVGGLARAADVRLSFHPYADVDLSAPDEERTARSQGMLVALAEALDALGQGPEGVIVLHVGGVYGDVVRSRERFCRCYEALPEVVRRRLALENDDRRFDHADVYAIHVACGVPLVFDNLHHLVLNRQRVPQREALARSLGSWPPGVRPKTHYSTARSEARRLGSGRAKAPTWSEHSDFVNPFDFAEYVRAAEGLPAFDVMLEAKARDLALLALREDLRRYAPQVAERVR